MEKEYNQIYGIVMDLLDKMVEILGEETVNRQEFRQLLESGLSQAKVALIPPSIDQVMVGDMERSRLKEIKALFFVGVNEGNIPKSTQTGGILSELDRNFFQEQGVELAPGPKELMNMQRFYLYLNMTKPGEKLILSYSDTNAKGEGISPAYLIGSIRSLYPKLEIENSYYYPEIRKLGLICFWRSWYRRQRKNMRIFGSRQMRRMQCLESFTAGICGIRNTEAEYRSWYSRPLPENQRTLSARVWRRHYTERFHLTVLPDWNVLQPVHLHISFSME